MKRVLKKVAAATVASSLLSLAVVTQSAEAHSGYGDYDTIVGLGLNNPPTNPKAYFAIAARSGPNGESPAGFFAFARPIPAGWAYFSANITCMKVQGNLATVIGYVSRTKNDPFPADRYYLVRIKDMGQGTLTQDEIQNGPYTGDPYNCPMPTEPVPNAITKGGIRISDAS